MIRVALLSIPAHTWYLLIYFGEISRESPGKGGAHLQWFWCPGALERFCAKKAPPFSPLCPCSREPWGEQSLKSWPTKHARVSSFFTQQLFDRLWAWIYFPVFKPVAYFCSLGAVFAIPDVQDRFKYGEKQQCLPVHLPFKCVNGLCFPDVVFIVI